MFENIDLKLRVHLFTQSLVTVSSSDPYKGKKDTVKTFYLYIVLTLGIIGQTLGQDSGKKESLDRRFRSMQGINFKFNKKTSINASIQSAYKSNLDKIYTEYAININYKVGKVFLRSFLTNNYIGTLDKVKAYRVMGARLSTRLSKSKYLRFYGRLQGEYHSENQHRYRWRIIPSLVVRSKRFKLDDRVRINFSATVRPYFRIGGSEISQYDEEGEYLGEFSPMGFHRLRYSIGAHIKYKNFIFSTSVMNQNEFNLFKGSKHNINQVSKRTGKINHKFREYQAINLSVNYILNWGDVQSISDVQEEI